MARKVFKITGKTTINNKTALGIIVNLSFKTLAQARQSYVDKKITIKNKQTKKKGKITALDGYRSNQNSEKLNVFILTDIEDIESFEVGDTIEIQLK